MSHDPAKYFDPSGVVNCVLDFFAANVARQLHCEPHFLIQERFFCRCCRLHGKLNLDYWHKTAPLCKMSVALAQLAARPIVEHNTSDSRLRSRAHPNLFCFAAHCSTRIDNVYAHPENIKSLQCGVLRGQVMVVPGAQSHFSG